MPQVSAAWTAGLNTQLKHYYSFEDNTGTKAIDNITMINNGTLMGATWATGLIGKGLSGTTGGFFNIAQDITDTSNTTFSVSMWLYDTTGSLDRTIFGDSVTGCSNHCFFIQAGVNYRWYTLGNGLYALGNSTPNAWKHTVLIKNATGRFIYVNGSIAASDSGTGMASWANLQFGKGESDDFNGKMDEIGIWNRSLTDAEVGQLYNSGAGISYKSFIPLTVNLISPVDNYVSIPGVVYFNCSTSVTSGTIANITLWNNATANQTLSSGGISNSSYFNMTIDKTTQWTCSACNNTGGCAMAAINRTVLINRFMENSQTFNAVTTEGATETFQINITVNPLYRVTTANLIYNGTIYAGSISLDSANNYLLRSIIIPGVTSTQTKSFYWSVNFDDNGQANSTIQTQSVQNLGIDDCTSYTFTLFNMTLYDEETQTLLAGGAENTSIKVTLSLLSSTGNLALTNYSHWFNYTNPGRVCLQNPLNSSVFRVDGVIEYSSRGRFTEYYHIQNYNLSNTTDNAKINLYNLNSSRGQEFKITYKDSNFVPVEGAIFDIQRKYIDEGIYKTTERPKTGAEGYTIGHLVVNDVIYTIIVMKEGIVLATFNDIVANCQNPLLSSCSINLNSFASGILPDSFATSDDITYTLIYNKTTRSINTTYSIISGVVATVSLNVTLFDTIGNTSVCADQLSSSGGQLGCSIPSSFGNATVIAQLYKNGELVGQAIIKIYQNPSDIYGSNLIFIALFGIVLIIGIGISDNPMMLGIMMIVGLVVMVAVNLIYSPSFIGVGATILWFIVAMIIILIKGSNRQ